MVQRRSTRHQKREFLFRNREFKLRAWGHHILYFQWRNHTGFGVQQFEREMAWNCSQKGFSFRERVKCSQTNTFAQANTHTQISVATHTHTHNHSHAHLSTNTYEQTQQPTHTPTHTHTHKPSERERETDLQSGSRRHVLRSSRQLGLAFSSKEHDGTMVWRRRSAQALLGHEQKSRP